MKKYISLDEHLHLIAEKATRKCVGIPTNMELFDFPFKQKAMKLPRIERSNITTINPIK